MNFCFLVRCAVFEECIFVKDLYSRLFPIEFEFRVYFTGNKVVYKNGGAMITGVPVTDVTTSAANKNYDASAF